jgi:hypothetical protein
MSEPEKYYVLDAECRVVEADLMTWAHFFERIENRTVGWTQITSECVVSTVFLGINHQFGKGPPIVFETLVIGGPLDGEGWRYSSWDDANAGHEGWVRKVRAAVKQRVTSAHQD